MIAAILQHAPLGIVASRERRMTGHNDSFREMFGFVGEQGVGLPERTLYRCDEEYAAVDAAAAPLLAAAKPFQTELFMRRQDGSDIWVSLIGYVQNPDQPDEGTIWIIEDHSERRRAAESQKEELRHALREMEAIMHNAPVGIGFSRLRNITRYNRRFGEMFGYPADSGVGLPARLLYRSQEEYEAVGRVAAPQLSKGLPFQTELFMRRRDGTDIWVNLIGYVQDADNPDEATIWIGEDRSAYKQAEEKLQRAHAELGVAKERAEVANRAKSEFLASMSHELRTPLNAILGYAQMLKREKPLGERQALGLDTIENSGRHLLTLINDILDLSRIEAGKLELHPEALDLPGFLRLVADIIRVKADEKGLALGFDVAPDLPGCVAADPKALRQVLLNLLGNAVKFTDRGTVTLQVRCAAGADGAPRVHFEVRDTGVGIDPRQSQRLFQPFEQVSDAPRRAGGTGLGLSISRELVRAMGGDIGFESQPGAGSRFWFDLSLPGLDTPARAVPRGRRITGYRGPRKTVLIVDDVAANRSLIAEFLKMLGFVIVEAEDGRAAMVLADAAPPDLILMDSVMPVVNGLEATRLLRGHKALSAVPIITVSANASQADRDHSLAVGVDAFVPKPIDFDLLLDHIESLLGLSWTCPDDAFADTLPDTLAGPLVAPPPDTR